MRSLFTELKKTKNTGITQIMPFIGILGAIYTFAFILTQKETLLSFGLSLSEMLLTQANSLVLVLNLFGIILIASIIYGIEYRGNAIKKMYMLPVKIYSIYINKLIICTTMLLICIFMEHIALYFIGKFVFGAEILNIWDFILFAGYSFISSLPTLTFMMMISSKSENIWIVIGIGVLGFLSGMTMVMGNSVIFLLNPFVLILKPAINGSSMPSIMIILVSLVQSILFTIGGVFLAEKSFYE